MGTGTTLAGQHAGTVERVDNTAVIVLVSGGYERLTGDRARECAREIGLPTTEIDGDRYNVHDIISEGSMAPLFGGGKTVLVRNMSRLAASGANDLAKWLESVGPACNMVIEWDASRVPVKLVRAVEALGGRHEEINSPKRRGDVIAAAKKHFNENTGLLLDSAALGVIADCIGDDVGRLGGIGEILENVYGSGSRIGAVHVEPLLVDWSDVPPWALTDAIDSGDMTGSLNVLQRMWANQRHPLAVMATLTTHYLRVATLDGSTARNEKQAAVLLGMKGSTFPAKKALALCNRLGRDKVAEIVELLAEADVDMRGRSGLDGAAVCEVLCARLAALVARKGR